MLLGTFHVTTLKFANMLQPIMWTGASKWQACMFIEASPQQEQIQGLPAGALEGAAAHGSFSEQNGGKEPTQC